MDDLDQSLHRGCPRVDLGIPKSDDALQELSQFEIEDLESNCFHLGLHYLECFPC